MGLFKNLFKRKKGGTLVGNLIRGVANSATGGILGNGSMLIKDEPVNNPTIKVANPNAYQIGQNLGVNATPYVKPHLDSLEKEAELNYLKKNWWKLLIGLVSIIGLTVLILKKSNKY